MFEINQLIEVSSLNEANKYFNDGWTLIDTYKTSNNRNETLHYVIGQSFKSAALYYANKKAD